MKLMNSEAQRDLQLKKTCSKNNEDKLEARPEGHCSYLPWVLSTLQDNTCWGRGAALSSTLPWAIGCCALRRKQQALRAGGFCQMPSFVPSPQHPPCSHSNTITLPLTPSPLITLHQAALYFNPSF